MLENCQWHIASISPPSPDVHWSRCFQWCETNLLDHTWAYQGEGVFAFVYEKDYGFFLLKFG